MPELPEVETARRLIEQSLIGAAVSAVELRLPKMLRFSDFATPDILIGRRLEGARRRAKVLILDWSGDLAMLVHLKLSGQVSIHNGVTRQTAGHPIPDPAGPYPHKSTHLSIDFDNGATLHISDLRQFGWVRIMPATSVDPFLATQSFGPEGIGAGGLDADQLARGLARRSIPVKLALLDQKVVAGIGNIYVDEALHRAKIHPLTPANRVPAEIVPTLLDAIRWALETGLAQGGAKIVHNKAYPIDGFPEVHARKGEVCPVCGDTIVKIRAGPRGTYLCPTCQPESTAGNRSPRQSAARTPPAAPRRRRGP
jgi:formamidopyrimidine-DNA glycosylase